MKLFKVHFKIKTHPFIQTKSTSLLKLMLEKVGGHNKVYVNYLFLRMIIRYKNIIVVILLQYMYYQRKINAKNIHII